MRIEHHQHAPVEALHGSDHRFQRVGPAVGFFALVFGLLVGEGGALLFERDLGFEFALVELALLGLDQQFGLEFVLLDPPLLLDGGVAARVDGLVGVAIERFAGFGFEGLRHFRGGLQRENREVEDLDAKLHDFGAGFELVEHASGERIAMDQGLAKRQTLDLGANQRLQAVDEPFRKLLILVADVPALASRVKSSMAAAFFGSVMR